MLRVISRPAPPPPRAGRGAAAPGARRPSAGPGAERAIHAVQRRTVALHSMITVHGPCDTCRFHQLAPLLYTVYSPSHRPTGKGNLGDIEGDKTTGDERGGPSGVSLPAYARADHHQPVLSALVAYGSLSLSRARTQLSSVAYDGIGSCMRPVVCWPIRWLIRWEDTSP